MTTPFGATRGLRHGEERPGEAAARLEPRTASMPYNSYTTSALDLSYGNAPGGGSRRNEPSRNICNKAADECRGSRRRGIDAADGRRSAIPAGSRRGR